MVTGYKSYQNSLNLIHEKHDLNREIRKTRGFMKTQRFRPSPEEIMCVLDTQTLTALGWRNHGISRITTTSPVTIEKGLPNEFPTTS